MSNKPHWLAVTVYIDRGHVEEVTEWIAEEWFDDFGEEVFDLLGMTQKGLADELVDMPVVRDMIWKAVTVYGESAFDCVGEYMDFDRVDRSKEMICLRDTLEFLGEILDDVHSSKNDDCADAIATLKRAGYKIVRA